MSVCFNILLFQEYNVFAFKNIILAQQRGRTEYVVNVYCCIITSENQKNN